MSIFVSADSFFEWLFCNGYAKRFVWKDLNRQTSSYNSSFICEKSAPKHTHSFQITVIDGHHLISELSVKIFCAKHRIDFKNLEDLISKSGNVL